MIPASGCTVPGSGRLAAGCEAVTVRAYADVKLLYLAPLIGTHSVRVTKEATGMRRANGSVKMIQ